MRKRKFLPIYAVFCLFLWGYMGISLFSIPSDYIAALQFGQGESGIAEKEYNDARDLLIEIGNRIQDYTICFRVQVMEISTAFAEENVTLYGIDNQYKQFREVSLTSGRLIDVFDISDKSSVAVLDQDAALRLFPGKEAVGQQISMGGEEYTIVGVCKSSKRIGENTRCMMYIPYTASDRDIHSACTMECLMKMHDEQDYTSLISLTLGRLSDNCTVYSIHQERFLSLFPMLITAFVIAFACIVRQAKHELHQFQNAVRKAQNILREYYWHEAIGKLLRLFIPRTAVEVLLAVGSIVLFMGLLHMLTLFSVWIPDQISNLSSWQALFWRINDRTASSIRLNCMESSQMDLYQRIYWLTASAGLLFTLCSFPRKGESGESIN